MSSTEAAKAKEENDVKPLSTDEGKSGSSQPSNPDVPVDTNSPATDNNNSTPKSSPKKKRKRQIKIKPSHILMALSANQSSNIAGSNAGDDGSVGRSDATSPQPTQQRVLQNMDAHIQNDYIAKRKRAYESLVNEKVFAPVALIRHAWDGVSKVERSLIECCEGPNIGESGSGTTRNSKNEYGEIDVQDSDEYIRQHVASLSSWSLGGVLDIEHETRFAAVLATQCHNMASKSLALAILERTLEVYLRENAAKVEKTMSDVGKSAIDSCDGDSQMSQEEWAEQHEETRTRSSRFKRVQHLGRNMPQNENVANDGNTDMDLEMSAGTRRFEKFFAVGGLKVLNQWLAEGSGYDIVSVKQQSIDALTRKPSASTPEIVLKRKAPVTRPIVYTILRFLEHIPFDKTVVMDSKINKQVQKLGKKVSVIMEAQRTGKAPAEDLENWTTDDRLSADKALSLIREAVNAVKASWREKTNIQSSSSTVDPFVDPFQLIKNQIKERLEDLTQFEAGVRPQPEWYVHSTSSSSLSANQKSSAPSKKKLTKMQELAALERKVEREKLQRKIREVKKKNQASLALLREKLQKQREEFSFTNGPKTQRKEGGKSVCWKDGLNSEKMRHRRKLEEVFVYIKGTPSAGWEDAGDGPQSSQLTDAEQPTS